MKRSKIKIIAGVVVLLVIIAGVGIALVPHRTTETKYYVLLISVSLSAPVISSGWILKEGSKVGVLLSDLFRPNLYRTDMQFPVVTEVTTTMLLGSTEMFQAQCFTGYTIVFQFTNGSTKSQALCIPASTSLLDYPGMHFTNF